MGLTEAFIYTYARYFIGTGLFYFVLVGILSRALPTTRINQKQIPGRKLIFQEIRWSLTTAVIYSLTFYCLFQFAVPRGWTEVYNNVGSHGYGYFFFSIIFFIFLTETLFYWSHRLLHTPFLFKKAHFIHHRFKNPTAFAVWAFHPLEAIIQTIIFWVIPLFVIPIHEQAYMLYVLIVLIYNALGHSGVEFLPPALANHPIWRFHNTPTHHNMHHRYVNYNFGLYFNFWDRLFKTNHPDYEVEFLKHTPFKINKDIPHKGIPAPSTQLIPADLSNPFMHRKHPLS